MIKNRPALLALLTALNFLSYIDRLVLPAVLASVEKELDLSKTAAGLGATAFLIGHFVAAPLAAASFFMPAPAGFFAVAFFAEVGLFLPIAPVTAVGLRAVPAELRASAMATMIFAIHLLGDLWSPPALGLLQDALPVRLAMMALSVAFAISAAVWWPRALEAA